MSLEHVHVLDADEYAATGGGVSESGSVAGGFDLPAAQLQRVVIFHDEISSGIGSPDVSFSPGEDTAGVGGGKIPSHRTGGAGGSLGEAVD